jgi:hypothetical protein
MPQKESWDSVKGKSNKKPSLSFEDSTKIETFGLFRLSARHNDGRLTKDKRFKAGKLAIGFVNRKNMQSQIVVCDSRPLYCQTRPFSKIFASDQH